MTKILCLTQLASGSWTFFWAPLLPINHNSERSDSKSTLFGTWERWLKTDRLRRGDDHWMASGWGPGNSRSNWGWKLGHPAWPSQASCKRSLLLVSDSGSASISNKTSSWLVRPCLKLRPCDVFLGLEAFTLPGSCPLMDRPGRPPDGFLTALHPDFLLFHTVQIFLN